ncbi:MAG: DUF4974 domain-containing protein [Gemmatimonas sp.]|nr:DUF4974 domain-containing protein [Gemmatimonas sp.]
MTSIPFWTGLTIDLGTLKESIIRSLQGRASESEEQALLEWRTRAAENETYFREVERIWGATAMETAMVGSRPTAGTIIAKAVDNGSATVIPLARPQAPPSRPRTTTSDLVTAAAVVLALGATALWWTTRPATRMLTASEIVTGPAEMATTRLSDGTTVRLAPQSRLLIRANRAAREVWLDGHAFFAVAHDEAQPFTVRTRVGDALVLGTRFDIRVQDQEVRVAVVEGRVALAAQGGRVEVGAGEVSRASDGSEPEVEQATDIQPLLAWMDGFLAFQDTPLGTVAGELEERFGIRVLLRDPELAQRTVSAWFTTEDAEEVLSVVCRAAGAHCTLRDSIASIEP